MEEDNIVKFKKSYREGCYVIDFHKGALVKILEKPLNRKVRKILRKKFKSIEMGSKTLCPMWFKFHSIEDEAHFLLWSAYGIEV